ncbi:hypothetical protein [Actinomycetospora sp.]|jgi:hypothetical protein|uniref:hypothetical protein n=1 Tax=Actinomycetospora sp. TaxID=1872135 RepID=UPI002F4189FE
MTGTHDTPSTPASSGAAPTPDDHDAAEMAAYLAAEGVANDYHPDEVPPDHVAG